jgi:hypothetical protein
MPPNIPAPAAHASGHRESVMSRTVRNLLLLVVVLLAGCSAIGGIFKAGMWTGILALVVVIAIVAWLFSRGR